MPGSGTGSTLKTLVIAAESPAVRVKRTTIPMSVVVATPTDSASGMPKSATGMLAVPKALPVLAEKGSSCSVRTTEPSIKAR